MGLTESLFNMIEDIPEGVAEIFKEIIRNI